MPETRRHWQILAVTMVALFVAAFAHEILSLIPSYRWLHARGPFYFVEIIDEVLGLAACVLAIWWMYRVSLRGVLRELGLSAPLLPAITFALAASSPMLIGFALTRSLPPHIEVLPLLYRTVLAPLVEEIEFRGFGVRQLLRGTKWPFWIAAWPSAVMFGYVHVEQGQSVQEMLELFLLTGCGGVILSWVVYRWQNLWVAVALHLFMNLWWELFSVARSAIGGWIAFILQSTSMGLAILLTCYWTRPQPAAGR